MRRTAAAPLSISIAAIAFDCRDAATVATFWSAAFEIPLDSEPTLSEYFASFGHNDPDAAASMMFIQVSASKAVKNRVHLDLQTDDRAGEVERFVSLGTTIVHDKDEGNIRWTTLTDPEGNEFCVASH